MRPSRQADINSPVCGYCLRQSSGLPLRPDCRHTLVQFWGPILAHPPTRQGFYGCYHQYLRDYKQKGEAFSVLTSYDATFAQIVSEAGVDVILIGDSLGMVLQGHDSTLPVTMDQMVYHVSSVAKGNRGSLIMADMPL